MKNLFALCVLAFGVAGCATPESNDTVAETATPQKKCEEATTGSNVKRCDRGDVKVITREELERNPFPSGMPRSMNEPMN